MGINQPKVSALLNGHLANFSSERLMRLLTARGQDVEIVVKAKRRGRERGSIRVVEAEVERLLARRQPATRRHEASPDDDESLEGLSARNRLHGFIEEVRIDGLLAQVQLRVGSQSLTAVITADAVRALKLRRGEDAIAIIKSTEVMIARGPRSQAPQKARTV